MSYAPTGVSCLVAWRAPQYHHKYRDTEKSGAAFSVTYPETFLPIRLRGISRSFKAAVAWVAWVV